MNQSLSYLHYIHLARGTAARRVVHKALRPSPIVNHLVVHTNSRSATEQPKFPLPFDADASVALQLLPEDPVAVPLVGRVVLTVVASKAASHADTCKEERIQEGYS